MSREQALSAPRKTSFILAIAIAGLAPNYLAVAQSDTEFMGLEEVVVTARKREESVQSTPVSMVAFSEMALEARSISSFKQIGEIAPNIEINGGIPNGGGSATQIFIRGVGQDDYSFPNEPGVGLYIDGVYISRSAASDFGFMDIERIEILRGPQGTLYGRNTIGGAVKIVTNKPTGETGGRVGLTLGNYDRVDAYVNYEMPLSETVAAKFAIASFNRDGLGENLIGQDLSEEDELNLRVALRWQPSDTMDVLFSADYMTQEQAGPAGSMVRFGGLDEGTDGLVNGILAPKTAAELGLESPFDVYGEAYVKTLDDCDDCVFDSGGTVETRDDADIWGMSLTVNKDYGSMQLQSITAIRDYDIDIRRDSEHTPFDIVQVDNPELFTQYSQEFQFTGQAMSDRLDWVAGFYGLYEDGESELFAPLLSGLFDEIGLDLTALINTDYEAYSVAAYAEGTYHLSDRLGITLGGRFTHDDKEYIYGLSRPESGAVPLPPETLEENWTEFLPKLGIEFQQTDDLLWYGNASRGYKAGGYNSRALSGNAPKAYDPEYINAFEAGVKSTLFNNTLILNGAIFYNDYQDIQLLAVLDLGGGNVETVIENAGEATIIGGELEFQWAPVAQFNMSGGIGLLDSEYDDIGASASSAGITEDNKLINAPELSANLSAEYIFTIGQGDLTVRADMVYRDEQYRDAVNTPELMAESYSIWNGRMTYTPPSQNWEIAAFVTNITDELYVANGVEVLGLGYVEAYYNRPREWGLSFSMNFGD
ncbi:MAG: iron complex outermembrane receptor protein [Halieaceae bacterium]|jgi:iron complex outermembrane receptor protein